MTNVKMGLMENFAITNWYRFLLYIGGVILILSLFLEPKGIDSLLVKKFSFYTVILSLLVWIIDDILYKIGDFIEYENRNYPNIYVDKVRDLYILRYIISFIALLFWSKSLLFGYLL